MTLLAAFSIVGIAEARSDATRTVTVQWDANTEPDLAGYLVAIGTAPDAPLRIADVGLVTSAPVEVPVGPLFYVWVSAYSTAGLVSRPSQAIAVAGAPLPPAATGAPPEPDLDADGDGMPDAWELANNVQDPLEDKDKDGVSALDEWRRETDPSIPNRWILGEGSQGQFEERLAFLNPGVVPAQGLLTFRLTDGTEQKTTFTVAPLRRTTLELRNYKILSKRFFSVIVDVTRGGVIVERLVQWADQGNGVLRAGHAGKGIGRGSRIWYFPDGNARDFQTALTLTNDEPTAARVSLQFYRDGGTMYQWTGQVPARNRITMQPATVPELIGQTFWIRVVSDVPIIAERTVTWMRDSRLRGGHLTAGASNTSRNWYLAEGSAGGGYATQVLLLNPTPRAASATVSWLHATLPVSTQTVVLQPNSRISLDPAVGTGLPGGSFAAAIEATDSIVAERVMYWPVFWWNDSTNWDDGHASMASPLLGRTWLLAEGEIGGTRLMRTVLAVGNPGTSDARLTITFIRESVAPVVLSRTIRSGSRLSVDAADVGLPSGERFGIVVDSDANVVVERSMYWSSDGGYTIGGINEMGLRTR